MSVSECPDERLGANINVRVPVLVHAEIAKVAEGSGATLSGFVREAIRKAVAAAKADATPVPQRRQGAPEAAPLTGRGE